MRVAPAPPPAGYNVAFRPHPGPQTTFLRTGARDVFFGGAAGPGKSVCMIAGGLRLFHLPHYRGKMFRRTRKQAQELIIKASRMIARAFPKARWNGNEHAFINPGGGRLEIGYLRHDMDLENEEGQEYQYVGFDELCQFPEHQAKFLHSRLRSAEGLPCLYRGTGNPRGIGLLWVKEHYVDPAFPETLHWQSHKLPDNRVLKSSCMFVPGRLEDNPSLGDDYEISLALLGNPKLYQALRYGDWGALMGDAFPEWDKSQHVIDWADFARMHGLVLRTRPNGAHVEEYCEIPKHWPIFMSYDWGAAKPFSVGWYTADDWGRLYRIYEWYGCRRDHNGKAVADTGLQMTSREVARGVLEREERFGIAGRVEMRVADNAIWNDRGVDTEGPSIQEMFEEEGVYFDTRSDKRRIPGKQQLHARLDISEYEMDDGSIEESPAFLCLAHCKDFQRTVPTLPTCPKDPEDVDSTAEDHIYDEWRYMAMSRPWHRRVVPPKPRWLENRQTKRAGMVRR